MSAVLIIPGYLAGAEVYQDLAVHLEGLGFRVGIVPLRWWDWLVTLGGRPVTPILAQVDRALTALESAYPQSPITLVGHSAGGWIARIFLGRHPYHGGVWGGHARVARLITLGSPHTSQERWTRANLTFVNQQYPGAFHGDVAYTCVAGQAVFGRPWTLAYESYRLTCGTGPTWGDGITPVSAAHLEGAHNLTLEGVWHSPSSPGPWYGSPTVVKQWAEVMAPAS